jgi:hypothetical protein
MVALYDTIGVGYRGLRLPDPRIASAILDALGDGTWQRCHGDSWPPDEMDLGYRLVVCG